MLSRGVILRVVFYGLALLLMALAVASLYRDELVIEWQKYRLGQIQQAGAWLTSDLPEVDEVRLLRLDKATGESGEPTYTIPLYEPKAMKVVATKTFLGLGTTEFLNLLRKVRLADCNHIGCHDPHHVMQLYHGGTKVGEMVICFSCFNVAIPTGGNWEVVNFDSRHEVAYEVFQKRIEAEVGAYVEPVRK